MMLAPCEAGEGGGQVGVSAADLSNATLGDQTAAIEDQQLIVVLNFIEQMGGPQHRERMLSAQLAHVGRCAGCGRRCGYRPVAGRRAG